MIGKFISLEGGEGVGKSTQMTRLAEALTARGLTVVRTREPGGSEGAEAIRTLLMQGGADKWSPRAEALLFAAARADHVEKTIRPAIARGHWVLCDRFIDSSRAYQSGASGLAETDVMMLHHIGSAGLLPDRTLILSLDEAEAGSRANRRDAGEPDEAARPVRMVRPGERARSAEVAHPVDVAHVAEEPQLQAVAAYAAPPVQAQAELVMVAQPAPAPVLIPAPAPVMEPVFTPAPTPVMAPVFTPAPAPVMAPAPKPFVAQVIAEPIQLPPGMELVETRHAPVADAPDADAPRRGRPRTQVVIPVDEGFQQVETRDK